MDRKTLLVHVTVQERTVFRLAYVVIHPHQQFHVMRGFPCFVPEVLKEHSEVADRGRLRSVLTPIRAQGGRGTPSLRRLAIPVGSD